MINGRTNETTFTHKKEILHEGELMGQFRVDKTLELLKGKFFWSPMRKDVQRDYPRCISHFKTNSKAMSHELYAPSPFASAPWEDISIDFILELPRTTKGFDSTFMVIDKLFFREVVRLHGLSPSIVLDREPKFENHFLRILLEKLGTKLNFSISYHPQTNGQNKVENITLMVRWTLTSMGVLHLCLHLFLSLMSGLHVLLGLISINYGLEATSFFSLSLSRDIGS